MEFLSDYLSKFDNRVLSANQQSLFSVLRKFPDTLVEKTNDGCLRLWSKRVAQLESNEVGIVNGQIHELIIEQGNTVYSPDIAKPSAVIIRNLITLFAKSHVYVDNIARCFGFRNK